MAWSWPRPRGWESERPRGEVGGPGRRSWRSNSRCPTMGSCARRRHSLASVDDDTGRASRAQLPADSLGRAARAYPAAVHSAQMTPRARAREIVRPVAAAGGAEMDVMWRHVVAVAHGARAPKAIANINVAVRDFLPQQMLPALPKGQTQEAQPAHATRQPAVCLRLEAMPPGKGFACHAQPQCHATRESVSPSRRQALRSRRRLEPAGEPSG